MSGADAPGTSGADAGGTSGADAGGTGVAVLLRAATRRLAEAGVASPRPDAETLLAHVLGLPRGDVVVSALRGDAGPGKSARRAFAALVVRREQREPLQHLTGTASFRGLELRVGPGVFVPRPETELVAGAAVAAAREAQVRTGRAPVVVDLCTGSGAIALALAAEVPAARVLAVELEEEALAWARRNVGPRGPVPVRPGGPVEVVAGDAATALPALDAAVDVVVSNPPYVPPGATPLDPEVRDHDPAPALYGGGSDGLEVPRAVVARAARLLRPGGVLVVEHADVQQGALLEVVHAGPWLDATGEADLTGRPRWVRAVRGPSPCHDAPS